jgi:hypothetical protein
MSEPKLDGQVEAFFDTFAAASDQLDADRLRVVFYLNHQDLTRALSPA